MTEALLSWLLVYVSPARVSRKESGSDSSGEIDFKSVSFNFFQTLDPKPTE